MFTRTPSHTARRLAGALAGGLAALAAMPALASACTPATSGGSSIFSALSDPASYVLAPGGTFESGAPGWTLSGAAVVPGNETYYLNSRADTHSLQINPGGTATTPPICVSSTTPTFRFVARQVNGSWAALTAKVLWTNAAGQAESNYAGAFWLTPAWTSNYAFLLGDILPTSAGQTYSVRLQFAPVGNGGGAVSMDDLYIDPYSRG